MQISYSTIHHVGNACAYYYPHTKIHENRSLHSIYLPFWLTSDRHTYSIISSLISFMHCQINDLPTTTSSKWYFDVYLITLYKALYTTFNHNINTDPRFIKPSHIIKIKTSKITKTLPNILFTTYTFFFVQGLTVHYWQN